MKNYKYIVWDWNGTVLDDLRINFEIENALLSSRGLREMETIEQYHSCFTFPIIKFYEKMGFDLERESFQAIAEDYAREYEKRFPTAALFPDAVKMIDYFSGKGSKQVILSMTERDWLLSQVRYHNIEGLFDAILGTGDILAKSKVDIARSFMAEKGLSRDEVLFIGDTTHDKEVADAVGCDCVLISAGHNSKKRLESTGAAVFESLDLFCRAIENKLI